MLDLLSAIDHPQLPGFRYYTVDEVLSPYVPVFLVSYLVAFIFTPIMRAIASHYTIIDQPDGVRKMHTVPVAYLGGVAVFLGWLAGLATSQFLTMHRVEEGMFRNLVVNFSIVLAACAIILLGLWDDILHAGPWKKILGQVFASAVLILSGIGKTCAWIFVAPVLTRTCKWFEWPMADPMFLWTLQEHPLVQVLSFLMVVALVVGCCNATNLMDGLDGLCGGVTAVIAAGFLFLAVHLGTQSGATTVNLDALRVVLGLALLGGVLAFIPFNFNPASIFMGDTGSMFLGFCCAVMMILFASQQEHFKWFLASLVMFSLPLLDTALAFTRRWVNGRPLFSADKFHFHHQLVARGFTVKQTVILSYGLAIMFALLGAAIVYIRTRYAVAVYLVVFGSVIVAAYKMGMVHERVRATGPRKLGAADAGTMDQAVEPGAVIDIDVKPSPPPMAS